MTSVSIILPCYNGARWINNSIKSILNQTFKNFELIIIDDGSKDNSKDIINKYQDSRIRYIFQNNKGFSASINRGIKESSGDFIGFIGQDDIWLTYKLDYQLHWFINHNDCSLLFSDYYLMDSNDGIIGFSSPEKIRFSSNEDFIKKLFLNNFIGFETVLIKRKCFENEISFDERMIGFSDHDMWLRLACKYSFGYLNKPTVKKRIHKLQISAYKQDETMYDEFLLISKAIKLYPFLKSTLNKKIASLYYKNATNTIYNNGEIELAKKKLLITIKYQPWNIRAILIYFLPRIYSTLLPNFLQLLPLTFK